MFRLGALADVARADVRNHVCGLAGPEREPMNQRHGLVPSKVTAQGGVVAILNDALAKSAAIRKAEAIRLALSEGLVGRVINTWAGRYHRLAGPEEGPPGRPCNPRARPP